MSMNSRKGKSLKINFEEFKSRSTENSKEPFKSNSNSLPKDINDMKLPRQIIRQINKENPCNRTAAFIEQLHKKRLPVTAQKAAQLSTLASKFLQKFNTKLEQCLQNHREARIQSLEDQPKFVDSQDIAKQKCLIKVCKSQILSNHEVYLEKKNFKDVYSEKLFPMVQKLEKFMVDKSEIIEEQAVLGMIHPLFERTLEINEQTIKAATLQCQSKQIDLMDRYLDYDQEDIKRIKLKRIEAARKKMQYDQLMNSLYPNNMEGILLNAVDLYSHS